MTDGSVCARFVLHLRARYGYVLKLPYTLDAEGRLLEARRIAALRTLGAEWALVHQTTDGVVTTVSRPVVNQDLPLANIELKAGDVFHVVLVEDVDGDGLGRRIEASIGTDPLRVDTDGDGVEDGVELLDEGTDPTISDL